MNPDQDKQYIEMLLWRGIDVQAGEFPCERCGGAGVRVYGNTATWRGGGGGSAMTQDICDNCWGSGRRDKPWTNLKTLGKAEDRRGERSG